MKYYEDLLNAGQGQDLIDFVLAAINDYKGEPLYQEALKLKRIGANEE